MIIEKLPVGRAGSCNFCSRGELALGGYNLKYPYKEVYQISCEKGGIRASVCPDCAEIFNLFVTFGKDALTVNDIK